MTSSSKSGGILLALMTIGVVVATGAGWVHFSWSNRSRPATNDGPTTSHTVVPQAAAQPTVMVLEMPSSNVQKMQAEIDELKRMQGESRAREQPVRAEPTPEEIDAHLEQVARSFEDRVKQEAPDAKWRVETERRAADFFSRPELGGVSAKSVNCRSTLCRIETTCEDLGARSRLFERVSELVPTGAEGFVSVQAPNDLEIEVYFSRTGPLAEPEQPL